MNLWQMLRKRIELQGTNSDDWKRAFEVRDKLKKAREQRDKARRDARMVRDG